MTKYIGFEYLTLIPLVYMDPQFYQIRTLLGLHLLMAQVKIKKKSILVVPEVDVVELAERHQPAVRRVTKLIRRAQGGGQAQQCNQHGTEIGQPNSLSCRFMRFIHFYGHKNSSLGQKYGLCIFITIAMLAKWHDPSFIF